MEYAPLQVSLINNNNDEKISFNDVHGSGTVFFY